LYKVPRGTFDILPEEQTYWRLVEDKAKAISELYGYQRIDTPVFEDARLFVRSIGEETDIVEKEMYSFKDRSGALMTLRPEGTAPVCRAYIEHGMHNRPQPVRLYYITPIFRYERPQAGRYRQHWQFGFEAIGDRDPIRDAEVIEMAWQFFSILGLQGLSLRLNSIGCATCRPKYLECLKRYYSGYVDNLCPDCKIRLERNPLRLLDCKKVSCLKLAESSPKSLNFLCQECAAHFGKLKEYLSLLELDPEVDHSLVRGLDYYTRTVFEIQPRGEKGAQSTLGGGGRYDDLIEELGGKPTPAVGFAAGVERIILNLRKQNIPIPTSSHPDVFIAYLGEQAKDEAIGLASQLRRNGVSVTTTSGERSLKAQLRQANALRASYALIIGEEEVRCKTVTVRDMAEGKQRSISAGEVVQALKSSLKHKASPIMI
jgi:histidyl-tRNA synthetase